MRVVSSVVILLHYFSSDKYIQRSNKSAPNGIAGASWLEDQHLIGLNDPLRHSLMVLISTPSMRGISLIPRASQHVPQSV